MAASDNDDCTSSSIANVLSEVNEFIDALDREEFRVEDHDGDGDGPPEYYDGVPLSLSIFDNQHALVATDNHHNHDDKNDYGDGDNAIHDSEELFSSLSSRYQMMNLETPVEFQIFNGGDENHMRIDANPLSDNEQMGSEIICGDLQTSSLGKTEVIDFIGVAGVGEIKHRFDRKICSGSTSIDIVTDISIGHSAGGSAKNSVASCVENVPPTQRFQHPQPHQQQKQFSSLKTQSSDVQLVMSKTNTKKFDKNNNTSPLPPSMATITSSSSSRIYSPFSAKSRQLVRKNDYSVNDARLPITDKERILFSLQNCRKVSLLLKVNPALAEDADDQVDDDGYGLVLFPALVGSEEGMHGNDTAETDWADDKTKESQMRHGEVILVNPKTFEVGEDGDKNKEGGCGENSKERIAGRVTVETARLVAEVSQISSEDWARTYKFDDVQWSNESDFKSYNSLSALASAAVEDVLSLSLRPKCTLRDDSIPCSTIIFAVGGSSSGKTQTIFGSSVAKLTSPEAMPTVPPNAKSGDHDLGLLGEIMSGIISSQRLSGYEGHMPGSSSENAFNCSISILEIVNEDVLRDILGSSNEGLGEHGGSKALRVQHSDNRGATVSNLRQVTVETMEQLQELLQYSFKSNMLRKVWSEEGGHGHFIVNVNIARPTGGCAKIQLVDLASPDRPSMNAAALRSVRKALSALRGVLRGIAMQHAHQDSASLKAPIPYRESTLTKLLQRSLDHQDGISSSNRAVVVGNVRPSTKGYNQTLSTMDFMTRIFAKTGETAHSPFRDGVSSSEQARQYRKLDGPAKSTSHGQESGKQDHSQLSQRISSITLNPHPAALKSITADPRQRLAKLANSVPLSSEIPGDAVRNNATAEDGRMLTDKAESFQMRGSGYGVVLDQLNSLLDADDNATDRNDYGDGIIAALTLFKTRISSDESSIDSIEEPSPSPYRENRATEAKYAGLAQLQPKNKLRGRNKMHTATNFPSEPSKLHFRQHRLERGLPNEKSQFPTENRISSVASTISFGSDAERLSRIQKVSEVGPPSIILPLDSMDSEEPLVSSRGHDIFFGDSHLPQKNNSVFRLAKDSPTFAMFESFKHEIDTLVASLTPRRAKSETGKIQMVDVPEGASDDDTDDCGFSNADPKFSLLEDEVTSLNAKVQSLTKEKSELEDFLSTIQSILKAKDGNRISVGSSWPQKYNELLSEVTNRHATLDNLESQLESSKAECVKLSRELNRAEEKASDFSLVVKTIERDLVEAQGKNRSHAEATSLLESHNMQLAEQLQDVRGQHIAFSAFLRRLDELLGIKHDEFSDINESQNKLRLGCIETLTAEVRDGLNKLKESAEREQQARCNVDQLNSQMHEVDIREKRLRESLSQLEAKRIAAEKLAEEAISAKDNLNNQLSDLRSKLVLAQQTYETLASVHKSALSENQTLRGVNEMMRSQAVNHESEISRLNGALAARRKDESQRDLASFKAKTIAVMKQHMEGLKVDYARRLEDFKSSYTAEKESDAISLLQLDLSNRKGENEILKRRIEQLEKSTSLKVQNAEENLSRIQGELAWARDDASKQRELNNKMQGELDNLRSLMDIAEESVGELNRLKEENNILNETLRTQNELGSRMSTADDDHFMHERISTLMRENEQNNISMRTLQAENVSLKNSIEQCTSTIQLMYSEMSDLKTIAIDGVSKLRTKEKSLLEEQQKSRGVITEMENRLENANNLIRLLQSPSREGHHRQSSIPSAFPNVFDRPTTPFVHHSSSLPPTGSTLKELQYAAELSTEKELRCKAEEICAGVLANSKTALEERDSEISKLRTQLFRLSNKRYS